VALLNSLARVLGCCQECDGLNENIHAANLRSFPVASDLTFAYVPQKCHAIDVIVVVDNYIP